MDYAALKLTHVSCAAVSYTLFVVRGIWMMRRPSAAAAALGQDRSACSRHRVAGQRDRDGRHQPPIPVSDAMDRRQADRSGHLHCVGNDRVEIWQDDAYSDWRLARRSTRVLLHRHGGIDAQSDAVDRLTLEPRVCIALRLFRSAEHAPAVGRSVFSSDQRSDARGGIRSPGSESKAPSTPRWSCKEPPRLSRTRS